MTSDIVWYDGRGGLHLLYGKINSIQYFFFVSPFFVVWIDVFNCNSHFFCNFKSKIDIITFVSIYKIELITTIFFKINIAY